MKIPELLAPAGDMEKLKTAIHYGADAVYMGGKNYSLRAHATNFNEDDLAVAVSYAHEHKVKVYITVNILAHNQDLSELDNYLLSLKKAGVDGLIVSDPGIIMVARKQVPEIPIHLSTQANVTNHAAALFWQQQGVSRLNLARELSLPEITEIKKKVEAEIEIFVHGALCISYSGRCMLSYYLTGRNANQGECAHPCRYHYTVMEEKRPNQHFPVEEDGRGTYIFNSKDLCLLDHLPQLIEAGVDSFKIEGRMKSVYYVGAVVRVYRAALDFLAKNGTSHPLPEKFRQELMKVGSRGYTENFIAGPPTAADMLHDSPRVEPSHAPAGIVRDAANLLIEIRNPLRPGEYIEYLGKDLNNISYQVLAIHDQTGRALSQANPGNMVKLTTAPAAADWQLNSLVRKETKR
ncbi:MAG: U32 family peptidase [Proteobacteria bacterium]|nr:U32 family peptidase [Pseudomonadota bacterium]MBU1716827.1 U32 family peptidase [Pseudomonadota bacterium]